MVQKVKSNEESTAFRNEGNAFYKAKRFLEALSSYNKSLCCAEAGSINFANCFGNRSAVYLEVNQYQKCLENIDLARKHGYLDLQKLKIREDKCLLAQKSHKANPFDDPWNFFKLSYPASEKIPYIASCLEIQQNNDMGRCIFTNRDLKTGDIIAIEKPYMKYLTSKERYRFCSHCLKSNFLSLIPCTNLCNTSKLYI